MSNRLALVFATVLVGCGSAAPDQPVANQATGTANEGAGELVPVELAAVGVDLGSNEPVVLLREEGSGKMVPIWIGLEEARAIGRALHDVPMPRPMTHDLMANLLSELDVIVEEVVVHELREATYHGMVRIRQADSGEIKEVDSRPSDALALAVRTGSAIRVARGILQDAPEIDFVTPDGEEQIARVLGMTIAAPTAEHRREFGLPARPGLVLLDAGGEAELRGLRRGDLIVEVNGRVPRQPAEMLEILRRMAPGEAVRITYWRDGGEHVVELSPGRAPGQRVTEPPRILL